MTPSGAAHSQLRYSACGAAEAAEETRGRWLSGPAGAGLLAVLLAGCGPSGAQSADVGVAELPGRVAVDVVQQLVGFPLELEPLLVYLAALAALVYQVQPAPPPAPPPHLPSHLA